MKRYLIVLPFLFLTNVTIANVWEEILEKYDEAGLFKSKIVCSASGTREINVGSTTETDEPNPRLDYFYISDEVILIRDSQGGTVYLLASKINAEGDLGEWKHDNADVTVTDYLISWKLDFSGKRANVRDDYKIDRWVKSITIDRTTGRYIHIDMRYVDDEWNSTIREKHQGTCSPIGEPKF
jgi:hypothetical protein